MIFNWHAICYRLRQLSFLLSQFPSFLFLFFHHAPDAQTQPCINRKPPRNVVERRPEPMQAQRPTADDPDPVETEPENRPTQHFFCCLTLFFQDLSKFRILLCKGYALCPAHPRGCLLLCCVLLKNIHCAGRWQVRVSSKARRRNYEGCRLRETVKD